MPQLLSCLNDGCHMFRQRPKSMLVIPVSVDTQLPAILPFLPYGGPLSRDANAHKNVLSRENCQFEYRRVDIGYIGKYSNQIQ